MALISTHQIISGTTTFFGYVLTGYSTQYSFGRLAPGVLSGNNILDIYFDGSVSMVLRVAGTHAKESIFHTLHIGSNTLIAADATHSSSPTETVWTWTGYTGNVLPSYLETYVHFSNDGVLDFGNYGVELYDTAGRTTLTIDSKVSFFKGYFSGSVPANTPYYAVSVPGLVATDRVLNMAWSKTAWIVEGTGFSTTISTSNTGAFPIPYAFLVISNGE